MSHRHIQHQLILYLDGELADSDMTQIRTHLEQCPSCRRHLESIACLWRQKPERVPAPPYLWTRVEARIKEKTRPQPIGFKVLGRLAWLSRPAIMLATLVVGILIGAYLGNLPSSSSDTANAQTTVQDNEGVLNASYLESFNDMPPGSVGQAYMLLASESR